MSKKTYRVRPTQIVSEKRGWVTFKDSKGNEIKARKSQIELIEGSLANRRVGDRKYNCTNYVKTVSAGGHFTLNNGDQLAQKLHGKELDDVYSIAAKELNETIKSLKAKYGHLNVGMQRMNLGNRIRGAMALEEAEAA